MIAEEGDTMNDVYVVDTPHAVLTFEEIPGMTVTTIETEAGPFLEDMVDDDLMAYFSMLDGDVTVEIACNNESKTAVITITQIEQLT
ncbi:MAG: hypothetical protein KKD01_03860 [Proteobacteria bacterium]|nr:hypothetical protein [Pseudomonadota bacterium]MBU1233038.1 hypothetical protein [Pseudomonadota bacterium]MBU1418469.1 hypothetical protein [Pseudomonadota bacterium]MBU1453841.1 hypothetical protein [Pseudomonadota bacterium]